VRRGSLLIFAAGLSLTGCVRASGPVIQTKLDALKGHPVQEAVDKLGQPNTQTDEGDDQRTYVWSPPAYYLFSSCTLKVVTDKSGKIADYDFNGSAGGCGYFAHLLDNTFKEPQDAMKPW
jgi:hypothetical protein